MRPPDTQAHDAPAPGGVTDGFFTLNADWAFTYVSEEAEALLGRTQADLIGHDLWQLFPEAVGSVYDRNYRLAADERRPVSFEAFSPRLDAFFEFRLFPAREGLSVYFRDVSREARTREALRLSEDRLGLAVEAAGLGWFTWDVSTGVLAWSDRCKEIYGLPPDAEVTLDLFRRLLHPDDADRVEADVLDCIARGREHYAQFRVLRPDGTAWVAAKGRSRVDAEGNTIRFEGVVQDITDRKRLEMALEAERSEALDRERHIAEALQSAVQPELPRLVPGMDLAFFFKAALDEADIGGDFADVFAVGDGCTAMVVGDLSGKGLAAASQVATVRNMLRAFLYGEVSIVRAVEKLNRSVAERGLLSGFVTLFVATFDAVDGSLRYVSCGHEPGLVRRAVTGVVEELAPTGPILGADEASAYEERTVPLSPGDALLLYTDGLTEAGRDFRQFLGVEGMVGLLASSRASDSTALVAEIIGGVQAHVPGRLRDDACLLAAVVSAAP